MSTSQKKGHVAGRSPIGVTVEPGKSYWWCACGLSTNQPFCDGSHKGSDFVPLEYKADVTKTVFFCTCKQTAEQWRPLCNGAHNRLRLDDQGYDQG